MRVATRQELDDALSVMPTVEELFWPAYIGTVSADSAPLVGVAPFALKVTAFALVAGATIAASDTDWWLVDIRKYKAPDASYSGAPIASKSTKVTAASSAQPAALISAGVDWNMDTATFSTTEQVFAKGDVLVAGFDKTGSPGNITLCGLVVRYQPLFA